ncbi:MAG: alpha/beta fold hydrolase [Candidatus Helarchaeota archaeon]
MPYISLDHAKLYYEEYGSGFPIIFIHGWTSNHWIWFNQVEYFQDKFHIITPDLKGHGASDKPEAGYLMTDFAADLNQFIHELLDAEDYCLIGHSMGGMVVLTYATISAFTSHLLGLVPCGTTHTMANPVLSQMVQQLKDGELVYNRKLGEMLSKLAFHGKFARQHKDLVQRNVEEGLKCPAYVAIACMDAFVNHYNIEKELPCISAPTLILTGDKDAMVDPISSEKMLSLIPNSSIHVIGPNVGHNLQLERPDEYNRILEAFIDSILLSCKGKKK